MPGRQKGIESLRPGKPGILVVGIDKRKRTCSLRGVLNGRKKEKFWAGGSTGWIAITAVGNPPGDARIR